MCKGSAQPRSKDNAQTHMNLDSYIKFRTWTYMPDSPFYPLSLAYLVPISTACTLNASARLTLTHLEYITWLSLLTYPAGGTLDCSTCPKFLRASLQTLGTL